MITTIVTVEKMQFTLGIFSEQEYDKISDIMKQNHEEEIDAYVGCFVSAIAGTNEDYKNPLLLKFGVNKKDDKNILLCMCEGGLPNGMMEEIGTAAVKEALSSKTVKWDKVSETDFQRYLQEYEAKKNAKNSDYELYASGRCFFDCFYKGGYG